MELYLDEFSVHGDSMSPDFLRLRNRCRLSAGGWVVGEKFDDRFDTEVGGFVAKQWQCVDENGQSAGDWQRTANAEIETVRNPSVIVDYANGGKSYTIDEAKSLPELAGVLARLQAREAAYVEFLAKIEEVAEAPQGDAQTPR